MMLFARTVPGTSQPGIGAAVEIGATLGALVGAWAGSARSDSV